MNTECPQEESYKYNGINVIRQVEGFLTGFGGVI